MQQPNEGFSRPCQFSLVLLALAEEAPVMYKEFLDDKRDVTVAFRPSGMMVCQLISFYIQLKIKCTQVVCRLFIRRIRNFTKSVNHRFLVLYDRELRSSR